MLPLIENGHIYIGQPPLYRLGKGKKEQYFLNDEELDRFLYSQASTTLQINKKNEEKLESEIMIRLLHDLSRFAQLLDHLQRLNVPEALVLFLLAQDIRNARQFEDSAVVENLVAKLKERQVQCSELRSCSFAKLLVLTSPIFKSQCFSASYRKRKNL